MFGGLHLLNLGNGQNLVATLLQAAWSTALGFLFAAVALRTQSILPLIIIHGSMDFVGFLVLNGSVNTYGPGFDVVGETTIEALIYITLGVFAMRGYVRLKTTLIPTMDGAGRFSNRGHEHNVYSICYSMISTCLGGQ